MLVVENYRLWLQVVQVEIEKRQQAIDARFRANYPGWRLDLGAGRLVPVTPPPDKEPAP